MRPRARRERAILRDRRRNCWYHPIGGRCWNCYEPPSQALYFSITAFDSLLVRIYAGEQLAQPAEATAVSIEACPGH